MSDYRHQIKHPCQRCGHVYGDHAPAGGRCLTMDLRQGVLFGRRACHCLSFRERATP